jgi:hypothetical protein
MLNLDLTIHPEFGGKMMNSNEHPEGDKHTESETALAGNQERDDGKISQDHERMSTSELLGRQEGHRGTQTIDGHGSVLSQTGGPTDSTTEEPLVSDAGDLNERWNTLQVRFVDEPKDAVREADGLVAEVIQKLTERFAEERDKLENQWQSGSDVSTEDLRIALRHYRSFFQRLLAA